MDSHCCWSPLVPLNILVGPLLENDSPTPYLSHTRYTILFAIYYVGIMIVAGSLLLRAFQRTVTKTSRRRMILFIDGRNGCGGWHLSLFAVWCSNLFTQNTLIFWIMVSMSSAAVGIFSHYYGLFCRFLWRHLAGQIG